MLSSQDGNADVCTTKKILKGLGAGLTSIPLSALLADPTLARAAAAELERQTLTLSGGREVAAYLARPAKKSAPAVMLMHEWWGLNDQIKTVARELAQRDSLRSPSI